ncbi:tyrosine-type recombinase/integrase [Desulfofustis limnaeus]|nr:integrase family protein [Desulfofustis limnaeus]
MERIKFTTGRIRDLQHPASGQMFYWDSEVRGLGVRATQSTKSFVYQGRINGKTIRIKIGDVRTWTIDSSDPVRPGARQEARRLQSLIDKGIDPRLEKQERLELQTKQRASEHKQHILVRDVWGEYLEDRRPHWGERHHLDHLRLTHTGGDKRKRGKGKTKPAVLSSLMDLKLADLTSEQLRSWATKEASQRPGQTRLGYTLLRAFFSWCQEHSDYKDIIDPSAFSSRIRKDLIPKQRPKSDSLQREQLKAWFSAVRKIGNKVISAYLQSLLLTGARREELAHLRWSDVDFSWNSLVIRDKADGTRTIPLTPYVAYLLMGLPQRNQWVFYSPRAKDGRLQEPRKAHERALTEAGIDNLSIHGLRRSFGTLSEWVETPVGIVYQIMGHKPSATAEKHYRSRPIDLLRKWHTKIEEWILEQAEIEMSEYRRESGALKLVSGE